MTQKFYFRNTQTNTHPTSGEKSTTEPVAASTFGLTPTDRDLSATKGASGTTQVTACNNTASAQNGCLGRWSSVPLAAGTYGSGTWTLAIQSIESNAGADAKFVLASIYFWRPSNNTVVGFVSDSNTQVGVEFGNNTTARYGQVLSITGANVTISNGDLLVIEVWTGFTQAMGTAANLTVCYDGTTDVTAAYAGTDPATYLQAPADIPEFVTASAGLATGTGAANNAAASLQPNAGQATGTGAANAASVSLQPTAGQATGTGTANAPSVSEQPTAGLASGAGTSYGPTPSLQPAAGEATGIGSALAPSTSLAPSAGEATGTGTAYSPAGSLAPSAGLASGTGSALDASGSVAGSPGVATGTGLAGDASASIVTTAGLASGSGAAHDAEVTDQTAANVARGTGVAGDASVLIQTPAGLATGTGAALTPTPSVIAHAGVATGTGSAFDPTVIGPVPPPPPSGSAQRDTGGTFVVSRRRHVSRSSAHTVVAVSASATGQRTARTRARTTAATVQVAAKAQRTTRASAVSVGLGVVGHAVGRRVPLAEDALVLNALADLYRAESFEDLAVLLKTASGNLLVKARRKVPAGWAENHERIASHYRPKLAQALKGAIDTKALARKWLELHGG